MVLSGTYEAVVDRSRDGRLVIAVKSGDEVVDELAVDPADLPESARRVGAAFTVRLAAGRLVELRDLPGEG